MNYVNQQKNVRQWNAYLNDDRKCTTPMIPDDLGHSGACILCIFRIFSAVEPIDLKEINKAWQEFIQKLSMYLIF